MKVSITYELNSEQTSGLSLETVLTNPVTLGTVSNILNTINREVRSAYCPVHNQLPRIKITVSSTGELDMDVEGCCAPFIKAVKSHFRSEFAETAYFNPQMKVVLMVEGAQEPFVYPANKLDRLIIGRSDPDSKEIPDLDLAEFHAVQRGISRRHATLLWESGALHMVDEGSANGTHLNGRRMVAFQPYLLHDRDRLTLGDLRMQLLVR